MNECPICKRRDARVSRVGPLDQIVEISCPACGELDMPDDVLVEAEEALQSSPRLRPIIMHVLRRMQHGGRIRLNSPLLREIITARTLPDAREQADNLILWIGDNTTAGEDIPLNAGNLYPVIGAIDPSPLLQLAQDLHDETILRFQSPGIRLRPKGWEIYRELKRGRSVGNKAFMAMAFGDDILDQVYKEFRTEVGKAGFNLRRLDDEPKAGSIDDRLRVKIRTSRFLVVDLTNENRGAYWEAGFAEGLGKPVFYTCEKSFFEEKGTHFDTSHLHTVKWESEKIKLAAEALKIGIRATLPDEAKMSDD